MIQQQKRSSGIPGLDEILHGGLLPASSYLLAGAAGAGKTILTMQWLLHRAALGEKCLYVSLSESVPQLRRNVASLGWCLDSIDIADLSPSGDEPDEYHVFSPSDVESRPIWRSIMDVVERVKPDCLVLDSVTHLLYLATDNYQFCRNVLRLVNFLNARNTTSLLSFDPSEMEKDVSTSLAVDGVIRLRSGVSPALAVGVRSIQIEKLRGSDFMSGLHPLRIDNGIKIFPHRIERTGGSEPTFELIGSGIPRLDRLLGGGIEASTTTLLTGPTGTGKSTLGTQFLAHFSKKAPAILFTFEEPASFIARRCASIGAPIDEVLASGALKIVRVNPLEQYPDEFLASVRAAVEQDGRRMVMIDSLRGYQLAMEEFGRAQAHIHNLVTYLSRKGVTTLLINEVEHITSTSLKATDLGVSHLADNILLLRYAEHRGKIIKVVCCLKKRVGMFEPELRQISVGQRGVEISEKLEDLHGILSGLPATA